MRPTRLQLEETIERFEMQREDWPPELTSPFVLIDELRALQEELRDAQSVIDQGSAQYVQQQRVQHAAIKMLARIHKLCTTAFHDDGRISIDEIRAVLRGEP